MFSLEFALFLVAIARKVGFDGYLINIERKVVDLVGLKRWLGQLTQSMQDFLPGSLVIWYDSVSAVDGEIRYQNALTALNEEFYHLTDGFFSNYWWNPQLLQETIARKGTCPKRVYIGNDCFGRNTYGGGKYDIYKATTLLET